VEFTKDQVQKWGKRSLIEKVLMLSDLHIPFHNKPAIEQAVQEHQDADLLVIGGDLMDFHSLSPFRKTQYVPLELEIQEAVSLVTWLAERFPKILVLDSNHNHRVEKSVSIPPNLSFLFESNLIRRILSHLSNVEVLDKWWVQIHDAVICHAERASKVNLKTAVECVKHFLQHGPLMGVQPFRVLVQAHTHAQGETILGGYQIKAIESGCMALLPLDYTLEARHVGKYEPQISGYVVLEFREGNAVLNRCRTFHVPYPIS
jgi:hypothetical protein